MANQILAWCIYFVHMANQIHEELENGWPFQIFNLHCTLL